MADKAKKEGEQEGGGGLASLLNTRQKIIIGGIFGGWTLIVALMVYLIGGPSSGGGGGTVEKDEDVFAGAKKPVAGVIENVILEMHVPYRTQRQGNPIVIISLALEFSTDWWQEQDDGTFRPREEFKYLRRKVTEDVNPLIRDKVYRIIGSRDIADLKGPQNKAFVEQLIKEEVNEILTSTGDIKEPPVKQAILTDYKFPE